MPTDDLITRIPDDATRIRTHLGWYVEPVSARRAMERYPGIRLNPVTCESGPVLLHVSNVDRNRLMGLAPGRLKVWSDGLLTTRELHLPADIHPVPADILPDRQAAEDWCAQYEAFTATERLLNRIKRAANDELTPRLWMPWRDATGWNEEETDRRTTRRALAADIQAIRRLTLIRHTVDQADGTPATVWEVVFLVKAVEGAAEHGIRFGQRRWLFTEETRARARLADLDTDVPPLVTMAESAALLNTTRDALAQAHSRAKQRHHENPFLYDLPPVPLVTTGRTNWYEPHELATFWRQRPGHGPGRGHTS